MPVVGNQTDVNATIVGTPNVNATLQGTPNVAVTSMPSVSVTNTPAVYNIGSSITQSAISGAQINYTVPVGYYYNLSGVMISGGAGGTLNTKNPDGAIMYTDSLPNNATWIPRYFISSGITLNAYANQVGSKCWLLGIQIRVS